MRILSILWTQGGGSVPRTLITGGLGQLGRGLAKVLRSVSHNIAHQISKKMNTIFREKHGKENVILSDIVKCSSEDGKDGRFYFVSVLAVTSPS